MSGPRLLVGLDPFPVAEPARSRAAAVEAMSPTARCFELVLQDPRHPVGSQWLVDTPDHAGPLLLDAYAGAGLLVRWAAVVELRREFGTQPTNPGDMFLIGVDTRPGGSAAELEKLREFHAAVHVPEVLRVVGYPAATTHAVLTDLTQTITLPRVLGMYYARDESADRARELMHALSAGTVQADFDPGPPAWRHRQSMWRLQYRAVPRSAT